MKNYLLLLLPFALIACNGQSTSTTGGTSTGGGMSEDADYAVATYDDKEIMLSELDAEARPAIIKAKMDINRARQQGLDKLIFDTLVELEAAELDMDTEAWLKQEVEDKIEPVTDEEARTFFAANPPRGPQDFDSMKPRVIQFLERQRAQERMTTVMAELKEKHGVKVALEPFRLEVSPDDDPAKGAEEPVVTIVEFADFQCGFCGRSRATTDQIMETYSDTVRFVFRDYPIAKHPRAAFMSQAANCAGDQDKYWEYYDVLFDNPRKTSDDDLKAHAADLSLDAAAFADCYDNGKYKDEVQKDFDDGMAVGVTGTPAFFINGRMISGAQPFEAFAAIIDDELERAGLTPPEHAAAPAPKAAAGPPQGVTPRAMPIPAPKGPATGPATAKPKGGAAPTKAVGPTSGGAGPKKASSKK